MQTDINNKCEDLTEESEDRTIWASTNIIRKYCDCVSTLYQLCCPHLANMSIRFEMTETALKSNMWGNPFNPRKVKIICFAFVPGLHLCLISVYKD